MIQIDVEKCKKDGFCVNDCPLAIIRQKDKNSNPEMVSGGDRICLLCRHCVAICPHGALSHEQVPIEACPPVSDQLTINQEQAFQFLRSRRSIRKYKKKPVKKDTVQRLINMARYAPTGSNSQLVEWSVFMNSDVLLKIAEMTVEWIRKALAKGPEGAFPAYFPNIVTAWDSGFNSVLREAPVLILASTPGDYRNGMVDLSIALSYLELLAVPMGLGTCWAGLVQLALVNWEPLRELVGLSKSTTNHYPMMLGYPKSKYHRLPERNTPKVTWK